MGKIKFEANIIVAVIIFFISFHQTECQSSSWCFQCSWARGGFTTRENHTTCSDTDDSTMETLIGPINHNPHFKPFCKGLYEPALYNRTGYDVLKQACYPHSCQTEQGGGRCIRWSYFLKGALYNVTLFCGIAEENGCFKQELDGGFTKEACMCQSDWCNTSDNLQMSSGLIVFISIVYILYNCALIF